MSAVRFILFAFALSASGCAVGLLVSEQHAHEARLIGLCSGRIYAAMEEDQFPSGCDWIEPIHFEEELL